MDKPCPRWATSWLTWKRRGGPASAFTSTRPKLSTSSMVPFSDHLTRLLPLRHRLRPARSFVAATRRPLRTAADFERFAGQEAQIRLKTLVDNRRNFTGMIREFATATSSSTSVPARRCLIDRIESREAGAEDQIRARMSRELLLRWTRSRARRMSRRRSVFGAVEAALARATEKRFKENADVRVDIDRESGVQVVAPLAGRRPSRHRGEGHASPSPMRRTATTT